MDFATILGIISGFTLILIATMSGGTGKIFMDMNSMLVVVGGTIAATFINYPMKEVISVLGIVKNAFRNSPESLHELSGEIVNLSKISRKEGILALEKHIPKNGDSFLRSGIQLAVDGTEPEIIERILESEIDSQTERHELGQNILKSMGTYSPAFGMIGTLMGLIKMLQNLSDPSQIGSGMALALVTTFYGAVLANLVFLPMAGKLEILSTQEVTKRRLILEGILAIQSGDNPRIVGEKLKTFIPPKLRNGKAKKKELKPAGA
jgi:chemotaxis protein MotA